MENLVHLVDETASGERTDALTLRLLGDSITVRDLITRRVEAEVALHNAGESLDALVEPNGARSNGIRTRSQRQVDATKQVKIALEAFRRNGFFVLVDDHHIQSLDEPVPLNRSDTVSFLRMMPLVGG